MQRFGSPVRKRPSSTKGVGVSEVLCGADTGSVRCFDCNGTIFVQGLSCFVGFVDGFTETEKKQKIFPDFNVS